MSTDFSKSSITSGPPAPRGRTRRYLAIGCLAVLLAPLLIWGGWKASRAVKTARSAERARQEAASIFGPSVNALQLAAEAQPAASPAYDIDKTVRVIHALDAALANQEDLSSYLNYLARQDYRNVAPDVLEARARLLRRLQDLYAAHADAKDRERLWKQYRWSLPTLLSMVEIGSGALGELNFGFNEELARRRLEESDEYRKAVRDDRRQAREARARLLDELLSYSGIYYDYLEEWDRVCIPRDRAYLAASEERWDETIEAADGAMELAPKDRESPLLKALALIESGEGEALGQPRAILDAYIQANPSRSAPAILLRGVIEQKLGFPDQAQLSFDQAAAYFPRQAGELADMSDPYAWREYLRKSREGRRVLQLYREMMLGAGFFSPDLQAARLHLDAGDRAASREKILDHFSRRRSQGRLDYILADLAFCYRELDFDFVSMFPEQFYLDLDCSERVLALGDTLSVEVDNRSDQTLRNASLLLCIHFTDMVRGDYETIILPRTVAVVEPGAKASFGDWKVDYELFGQEKGIDDIVEMRAILVANEAVVWVDTQDYKLAEIRRDPRRRQPTPEPAPEERLAAVTEFLGQDDLEGLFRDAVVRTVEGLARDRLEVELPKEAAILAPVFRLDVGGGQYVLRPSQDNIEDGRIRLKFEKRGLSEDLAQDGARLQVDTRFGSFQLDLGSVLAPPATE